MSVHDGRHGADARAAGKPSEPATVENAAGVDGTVSVDADPDLIARLARADELTAVVRAELSRAIDEGRDLRGMDVEQFVGAIVRLATAAADGLTEEEMKFALSAGFAPQNFSVAAYESNARWRFASIVGDEEELSTWLTTAEVAELISEPEDAVNAMAERGELLWTRRGDGRVAFARAQFADGRPLPGLAAVLHAFPADFDAISVSNVLAEPEEALDDNSPVEWMRTARPLEPLVRWVRELDMN